PSPDAGSSSLKKELLGERRKSGGVVVLRDHSVNERVVEGPIVGKRLEPICGRRISRLIRDRLIRLGRVHARRGRHGRPTWTQILDESEGNGIRFPKRKIDGLR